MLGKGFNQNEYKTGNSFKIYQLCIYCETCDLKILESSNLDLRNGFYQNIQKRVRLPYLPDVMMVASALLSGTIFAVLGWTYFHHSRSQFMDLL